MSNSTPTVWEHHTAKLKGKLVKVFLHNGAALTGVLSDCDERNLVISDSGKPDVLVERTGVISVMGC